MDEQDWLSQAPIDVLIQIADYLTGYDKLCLRMSCRRMYSILSEPRAWSFIIWRDCRKRDRDFKALRLALKLSRSYLKFMLVEYNPDSMSFPLSKFVPQMYNCQVVRHLTLTGMPIVLSMLERLLTKLPSLVFLSVSLGPTLDEKQIICAAAEAPNLHTLRVSESSTYTYSSPFSQSERRVQTSCVKAFHHWKNNNYVPHNLELCVSYIPFNFILEELTVSEHPALLSIFPNCSPVAGNVVAEIPVLAVSLHPNIDVVTCPAHSVCSSHRNTHKLILSPAKEPISAIVYKHTSIEILSVPTVSFLPHSLKFLCLAKLQELSSGDLTLVSESCPNIVCLDIHSCPNALLMLQGLSDIATNCLDLMSLNMKGIQKVENKASLWEVLGRIKKLRYLALTSDLCAPDRSNSLPQIGRKRVSHVRPFDMQSCSRIQASVVRLRLFALEIDYTFSSRGTVNYIFPLYFETLLPGLKFLQHLRILVSSKGSINITSTLSNLPSLTHLAIVSEDDFPTMFLPTDPISYSALRKLSIFCLEPKGCLESNLIRAVCTSQTLTHLCLSTALWNGFVDGVPKLLCECFVMVNHARKHGVHRQPIELVDSESAGVCGSLLYPKVGAIYSLEKVKDLQSLFLM